MEVLLFDHAFYTKHYNCTFIHMDDIPVENRQSIALGVVVLFSYFTFTILYLPCLYTMATTELIKKTSYKLMFLLGVIHVIGLQGAGIFTGVFAIEGAVYCRHPVIIYVVGSVGLATWVASTTTSLILGMNRCFQLYDAAVASTLFGSWRLIIWMLIPICMGLYAGFFSPPPLFNGMMMAWFFNPYHGYYEDTNNFYHNNLHTANNISVVATESFVYSSLITLYIRATRNTSAKMGREKNVYIQVALVGMVHFTASSCYVAMQLLPVGFYTTLVASTAYLLSQGLPPIIYLSVNKTLRNLVLKQMGLATSAMSSKVESTHSNAHTDSKRPNIHSNTSFLTTNSHMAIMFLDILMLFYAGFYLQKKRMYKSDEE